jgi:hypothetical protein
VNRLASSMLLGMRVRRWIEFEDFNESVSELAYLLSRTDSTLHVDIAHEVVTLLFTCDGIAEVYADDETLIRYIVNRLMKESH